MAKPLSVVLFVLLALAAAAVAGCNPYSLEVPCTSDAECLNGQICVVPSGQTEGTCEEEAPACITDAECLNGHECVDGECRPVAPECDSDADCTDPTRPICNDATGTCQPPEGAECELNADCGFGNHCDEGGNCQAGCESNADCNPATPDYCETSTGNCLPGCNDNSDCDTGETCQGIVDGVGHCEEDSSTGCTSNDDCDPDADSFCCDDGVGCNLGECFYFCTSDESCVANGLGNICNESTGQCSTGNVPPTGNCNVDGCASGFTCNPSDGICYQNGTGSCIESLDCDGANEVCIDGQCIQVECTTQDDCGGGYCWKGECRAFTCNADHLNAGDGFFEVDPSYIPGSDESDADIRIVGTGGFLGGDPNNPNIGWDPAQARFMALVNGKYRLIVPTNDGSTDIIRLTPRNFIVDFDDIDWDRDGFDRDEFQGFWFGDVCFQSGLVDEDDDSGYEFTGWSEGGECFFANGAAFYPNYLGSGNLVEADYNTASLVFRLPGNSNDPDISVGNMESYSVDRQNAICN